MPLDKQGFEPDITVVRQNVADQIRRHGKRFVGGFDRLEYLPRQTALQRSTKGTVFAMIGTALENAGVSGNYEKLGGVMKGLGYEDETEAVNAAHHIGCYCHGDITAELAADRIEGLNTP